MNNALGRSENPLLVILDGVSDVRNLGAIARSLECAGGHGIIVPAKGGAAINADAVNSKVQMGTEDCILKCTKLITNIKKQRLKI